MTDELEAPSGAPPSASPRVVRLMLCDDQLLVRARIREMLEGTPLIQIVGEALDGRAAVKMALELKPDIILMDISMPDLDGIEATRQILARSPGTRILAFSVDSDCETMRKMFRAGACGYLFKTGDAGELTRAIQKVLGGEIYLSIPPTDFRGPRCD